MVIGEKEMKGEHHSTKENLFMTKIISQKLRI
jgi:hypothetical protein